MATDLEKLVVSLEASISKYEKAMNRAVGISNQRAKQVESRWAKLNIGGDIFGGFVKGAAGALLPILTLTAALAGARSAMAKLGDIADKSSAAGLDAEFFQGVAAQAKLAGVEIEGFADAMSTFNKLTAQAVEGRGKLVTQLQGEHPELLKSIQLATTQEERLRLVADAIKAAKTQSEAAVIATAAFGDQGLKLVSTFRDGGAALDEVTAKAKAAGSIFDRELVARGDELGDKLDAASQIVDTQLKTALINLGPVIVGLTGLIGTWLGQLNTVLDQFNAIEQRVKINPLQNRLIELENRMITIRPTVDALKASGTTGGTQGAQLLKEYNDALAESLRLQERIAQLQGKPKDNLAPKPQVGGAFTPGGFGSSAFQTTAPTTFDFRNVLDPDVPAKFSKGLAKVADTVALDTTAFEELQAQVETATQLGQSFTDTFVNDLLSGKDAVTSLGDALGQLGKQLLKMGTDQAIQGLFSNLFGIASGSGATGGVLGNGLWGSAIFGGGRASGGPVEAGKIYKVNENTANSELFAPGMSGMVIPKLSAAPAARRGGDTHINIDARGAQRGVAEELDQWARLRLPGYVRKINADPHAVG